MPQFTPTLTGARIEPIGGSSPSIPLNVKSAQLTYDRTWSPYIQGTLVCTAQSAADAAATDPRKGLGVKFNLEQTFGGSTQTLAMAAWLRSRSTDLLADETTITFASIESLMQDYISASGQQYSTAQNDTTVVDDALSRIFWVGSPITGLQTVDGSDPFSIAAADAGWNIGSSIWDAVNGAEEAGNLWVRGDETGVALLRSAGGYTADGSLLQLTGSDRIISVVDSVSRDNPDWANAVFVNYPNATTGAGTSDAYAIAGSAIPQKTAVFTRQTKKPKGGAAEAIANRMASRGRSIDVTAIADLTIRPNRPVRAQYRGYDWTGRAQRATFRWPEGLMDLTVNVIES